MYYRQTLQEVTGSLQRVLIPAIAEYVRITALYFEIPSNDTNYSGEVAPWYVTGAAVASPEVLASYDDPGRDAYVAGFLLPSVSFVVEGAGTYTGFVANRVGSALQGGGKVVNDLYVQIDNNLTGAAVTVCVEYEKAAVSETDRALLAWQYA